MDRGPKQLWNTVESILPLGEQGMELPKNSLTSILGGLH